MLDASAPLSVAKRTPERRHARPAFGRKRPGRARSRSRTREIVASTISRRRQRARLYQPTLLASSVVDRCAPRPSSCSRSCSRPPLRLRGRRHPGRRPARGDREGGHDPRPRRTRPDRRRAGRGLRAPRPRPRHGRHRAGDDRVAAQYDGARDVVAAAPVPTSSTPTSWTRSRGTASSWGGGSRATRTRTREPARDAGRARQLHGRPPDRRDVPGRAPLRRRGDEHRLLHLARRRQHVAQRAAPGADHGEPPAGRHTRASDPVVAYDESHGVWLISTLAIEAPTTRLTVSRSSDGVTWSAPIVATEATAGGGGLDKNWIACDNGSTSPSAAAATSRTRTTSAATPSPSCPRATVG